MSLLVEHIQRFSLHDGAGIRTTAFLKGCTLRCPWCANPENLHAQKEYFFQRKKCVARNGFCALNMNCPAVVNQLHYYTKEEAENCQLGVIRVSGNDWESQALVEELLKDRDFFRQGGGITFSGGEPLLWVEQLSPVCDQLNREGIDLCYESCLFVPVENVLIAAKQADHFLVDVKILNPDVCNDVLHGNLDLYLRNLDVLFGKGKPIVMRFPLVPGITATYDNIMRVGELVKYYHPERLEIFSVHNLAENKYYALGKAFHRFDILNKDELNEIQAKISEFQCEVKICAI